METPTLHANDDFSDSEPERMSDIILASDDEGGEPKWLRTCDDIEKQQEFWRRYLAYCQRLSMMDELGLTLGLGLHQLDPIDPDEDMERIADPTPLSSLPSRQVHLNHLNSSNNYLEFQFIDVVWRACAMLDLLSSADDVVSKSFQSGGWSTKMRATGHQSLEWCSHRHSLAAIDQDHIDRAWDLVSGPDKYTRAFRTFYRDTKRDIIPTPNDRSIHVVTSEVWVPNYSRTDYSIDEVIMVSLPFKIRADGNLYIGAICVEGDAADFSNALRECCVPDIHGFVFRQDGSVSYVGACPVVGNQHQIDAMLVDVINKTTRLELPIASE